jgi:thioredoxin reductase (NADPH)
MTDQFNRLGSKWGLGGTCVNVGCIPKKLMHTAALIGELIKDSTSYGWQLDTETIKHSWVIMKDNIQNHIRKLNFGYKGQLRTVGVTYLNALGEE